MFQVEEGIALNGFMLDPYSGDVVHEPPLNIMFYSLIYQYSSYFFIFLDIATALVNKYLLIEFLTSIKFKKN